MEILRSAKILKLVERHCFKPGDKDFAELDELCFLSKNLYNSTLYTMRQHHFNTKEFLNYNAVNKLFTDENQIDYRALPAKVSKSTQMLVQKAYNSYFALLKKAKKGELSGKHKVKLPKYLPKDGRQVVEYTGQALSSIRKGFVKLSGTEVYIPTERNHIQFVRVVPKAKNLIVVEIGYEVEVEMQLEGNVAALDLGLNNLAVVTSNVFRPFIIDGRGLKNINQFYNKERARLSSIQDLSKSSVKVTNRMRALAQKRNNKISDYMHKASRTIVNHLVENQVTTLVVGYNKGWKQDIELGKKTNQNFVQIPFLKFVEMLEYKCALMGIKVVRLGEAYTSKCSFLDEEFPKKYKEYKGKRIKRGLFVSADGYRINADVNGSYNIMRKYYEKVWNLLNLQGDCARYCKENPYKMKLNQRKKKVS